MLYTGEGFNATVLVILSTRNSEYLFDISVGIWYVIIRKVVRRWFVFISAFSPKESLSDNLRCEKAASHEEAVDAKI